MINKTHSYLEEVDTLDDVDIDDDVDTELEVETMQGKYSDYLEDKTFETLKGNNSVTNANYKCEDKERGCQRLNGANHGKLLETVS